MPGDDLDLTPDNGAPGPDDVRNAQVIVGILGESPNPDRIRLYLDPTFRRSYQIDKSAIVRRQQVEAAASPLGVDASYVWVAPGTPLTIELTEVRRVEDEFLAGDFTLPHSFQPADAAGAAGGARFARATRLPACDTEVCTEFGIGCGSHHPAFPSCSWKCPSEGTCGIACGGTWSPRCDWTVDPSCWGVCR